jgi:hypothetical protein
LVTPRYEVVPATESHARALGVAMRESDCLEVWAGSRHLPVEAALQSVKASDAAWALLIEDEVAVLFGVAPADMIAGVGVVWALTADAVDKHPRIWHRVAKEVLPYFLTQYPVLINMVHASNTRSLRWLKKMGFKVAPSPIHAGPVGEPFHPIMLCKESNDV